MSERPQCSQALLCVPLCAPPSFTTPGCTVHSSVQAIQYVAEHGEVCPAGWKPGDKTMVADPEKSLDYFSTVGGDEVGFRS